MWLLVSSFSVFCVNLGFLIGFRLDFRFLIVFNLIGKALLGSSSDKLLASSASAF